MSFSIGSKMTTHRDTVGEIHNYGIDVKTILHSMTSANAQIMDMDELGQIKEGFLADIIAVKGNPMREISALRKVSLVMKNGEVYKREK